MPNAEEMGKRQVETKLRLRLRIMSPSEHLQRRSESAQLKVCAVAKKKKRCQRQKIRAPAGPGGGEKKKKKKKKISRWESYITSSKNPAQHRVPTQHYHVSAGQWWLWGGGFILNTSRLDTFPDCANANATTASCMQPGWWIVKL